MSDPTFWDFAVDLYGRPGVESACLALQDSDGLDVEVFLFCVWLGKRRDSIEPILDSAMALSVAWQAVVAPLRTSRRALKALSDAGDEVARLRANVKASELEAERLEIMALERLTGGPSQAAVVPAGRPTAEANLKRYFSELNITADLLGRGEVMRILNAAFPA